MQGDKDPPRKVNAFIADGCIHPLGRGGQVVLLEVLSAHKVHFREYFTKVKYKNVPNLVVADQVSPGAPKCKGGFGRHGTSAVRAVGRQ